MRFLLAMFLCAACAAPVDVRELNMAMTKADFSRMPSGVWMHNSNDSIISDAEYQALQKSAMFPYMDINPHVMSESGMVERAGSATMVAPKPGQTAQSVVDQIMRTHAPQNAAAMLATLGSSGFFNQFPGGPEVIQQLGPWIASRQSEQADASDFMGMNGISQGDVSVLSILGAPFLAGAGSAGAAGAEGGAYGIGEFAGQSGNVGAGAVGTGATATAEAGSIADQYAQLANANQGTQFDILAQAPTGTTTDVTAGITGSQMPAAVPEVPATLRGWGMSETAPGVWSQSSPSMPAAQAQSPDSLREMGLEEGEPGVFQQEGAPPAEPESSLPPGAKEAGAAGGGIALKDALQTAAAGSALVAALDGGDGSGLEGEPDPHETEEERQARIEASTQAVNQAFAGYDEPYFTGIADAYRNFQTPIFTDQVSNARRKLPMSVPHTQSSAYNRKASELELDIQRGEANLGRDAIGEANRRRGEIEMTRGELLNLAQSGADAETVAQQASSRAAQYAAPPDFSPIADLFEKYSNNALTAVLANRNKQPQAQISRPLTFSHSPSNSQRMVG